MKHLWMGCKMFNDIPVSYPICYRLRCFAWALSRTFWHGIKIPKGAFERLRNRA